MQPTQSIPQNKYSGKPNVTLVGECVEIAKKYNVAGEARLIMQQIGSVDKVSRSAQRRTEYLKAFQETAIKQSRAHAHRMTPNTLRWVLAGWLRQAFNLDILDREGLLKHFTAATACASLEVALAAHGPVGVFDLIARYIDEKHG